ncbi:MAG: trans-aconitate 2-methyltransferase [Streptosporangiaceae bacterium]
MWDPAQYLQFADERSRPFFELAGRIQAADPDLVVDLGCGPGQLTATLAGRWPGAEVIGIDSSPEMIEAARQLPAPSGQLSFLLADVRDWRPERAPDVIISNALLQWVPEQREVILSCSRALAPGGWLAFQVPGNFDQPTHAILRELAGSARWRPLLAGVELNRQAADPAEYLDLLGRHGCAVDAWETTYLHVLQGENPVLDWFCGTGLRPVLSALEPAAAAEFLADLGPRLAAAYPRAPYGTVLRFRRVFVVARRQAG